VGEGAGVVGLKLQREAVVENGFGQLPLRLEEARPLLVLLDQEIELLLDDCDALLRLLGLGAVLRNGAPGLEGGEPIASSVEPLPDGERRRAARRRGDEEE